MQNSCSPVLLAQGRLCRISSCSCGLMKISIGYALVRIPAADFKAAAQGWISQIHQLLQSPASEIDSYDFRMDYMTFHLQREPLKDVFATLRMATQNWSELENGAEGSGNCSPGIPGEESPAEEGL